ncbi:MAG: YciI family protein [Nitrososphaerota archaeon]
MLFAVIGSGAGKSRDEIMAIYPRHKAFLDQFLARSEVVGVGPFTDPGGGNMALFRSRAAAETFAKSDPFFLEGVVTEYQIKEWGDIMLS